VSAALVFALPDNVDVPTGGNIYDRELTRALMRRTPVELVSFDEAERSLAGKRPGLYFFDTLDLEKTTRLPAASEGQILGLLVHYLASLDPAVAGQAPPFADEARALERFALLVATSEFTRDVLASRGFDERRILTVPPALRPVLRVPRAYEPPLAALVVANLSPHKGVLPLLEALAALEPEPRFSLRIVGPLERDPAYTAACRGIVRSSPNLGRIVSFDGPVPYEQMDHAYGAAHLLVSAAPMETFGMAIFEARAHGLPVLAIDGGNASRHFEPGNDGISCASPSELARTLVELANDDGRMRELVRRAEATRVASGYGWDEAAQRFLAELERVGGVRA
jgi:glycosyltransferase involved in cell wall biosynthesis